MTDELELRRLAREVKAEHQEMIERAQNAGQHLANLAVGAREMSRRMRDDGQDTTRLDELLDEIDPQLEEIGIEDDPLAWMSAAASFADEIRLLTDEMGGGEADQQSEGE
jgi:hypothetical protein